MVKLKKKAVYKASAGLEGSKNESKTGKPGFRRPGEKKKVKMKDRGSIPVPASMFEQEEDEDIDLEGLDGSLVGAGASFLANLDTGALQRCVSLCPAEELGPPLKQRSSRRS